MRSVPKTKVTMLDVRDAAISRITEFEASMRGRAVMLREEVTCCCSMMRDSNTPLRDLYEIQVEVRLDNLRRRIKVEAAKIRPREQGSKTEGARST